MKLISKTTLAVDDAPIPLNESNHLYSSPELFEPIYGVPFVWTTGKRSIRSKDSDITLKADRKIILFNFDGGNQVWENKKEHKLRKKFIKQFKGKNVEYHCGYINGLQSPFINPSRGMLSANNFNGYKFWQQVAIL